MGKLYGYNYYTGEMSKDVCPCCGYQVKGHPIVEAIAEIAQGVTDSAYRRGRADALKELIGKLEQIDSCEFASYTLCLINEKVDEVLKGVET